MHMSDSLINPAIGGGMWAVSIGLISYSAKKISKKIDEKIVPLMGILGAFIFAAQMINFAIPGTGSSGHLGGGLILSVILGPYAGFLVMASILTVQALFFADGGLLALGCNIFNLGFFTCFIAYPLIYKKIVVDNSDKIKITIGAVLAAIIGLQLGAFSVVWQTCFSGMVALSFGDFLLLMQPIHLAIGVVEGLVTAALVLFVAKAQPDILDQTTSSKFPIKKLAVIFLIITAIVGSFFSWFASSDPDGLEWSVEKVISGSSENDSSSKVKGLHETLEAIQTKVAILPDYDFKSGGIESEGETNSIVSLGTSVSGLVGGFITLCLSILIGFSLKKFNRSS